MIPAMAPSLIQAQVNAFSLFMAASLGICGDGAMERWINEVVDQWI
jgi:hypothetical protein